MYSTLSTGRVRERFEEESGSLDWDCTTSTFHGRWQASVCKQGMLFFSGLKLRRRKNKGLGVL